ncbi:hypothetical protein PSHT_00583 [Puccinia striiformis]|uniref:DAGKc domain-containing protein n=2 Tax=Puccinia striiformis TaxID=27350 RepID=A0A2S4WMR8_9BASI|nr:hypothetical protein PSHT_00583 [Puccinia striiformis]
MTDSDEGRMKTERDYLLYILPAPATNHSEPAGEEARSEKKAGGLCWLTFPDQGDKPDKPADQAATEPEASPANGAIDEHFPKFFNAPPAHDILNIVRENFVPFLQAQGDSSRTDDRWMIIWNQCAGQKLSKKWLDRIVLPILELVGISDIKVYESRQTGWEDDLLKRQTEDKTTKVIILGGDGTISDFLNQAFDSLQKRKRHDAEDDCKLNFDLIILPLGTANAMFFNTHPEVKDLKRPKAVLTGLLDALLEPTRRADGLPEPSPSTLTLACAQTLDRNKTVVQESVSFVVTSTALHASILETANQLVHEPDYEPSKGTAVFKQAFTSNVSRTWHASVTLLPSALDGTIQQYDPSTERLVPVSMVAGAEEVRLEGPFSYFTACLVDRLESKFIIAPLRNPDRSPLSDESHKATTIDLVIIRPTRDPTLKTILEQNPGSSSARRDQLRDEALAKYVGLVMEAAYQEGSHINLLTDNGLPIVEYYRCGGWTWTPSTGQDRNQQACIDGKVIEIPGEGGSIKTSILSADQTDIHVY